VRRIHLPIFVIAAALMFGTLPASGRPLGTIDGTWQGSLTGISGATLAKSSSSFTIRIVVAGTAAQVFVQDNDGSFQEVKPGRFHAVQLGPSGMIAAIDSGHDNDGEWFETWDFAVTLKDHNTLIANFYRVVNNADLPLSIRDSTFSTGAAGELLRTR
jgi:hypothetical protein